MPPLGNCLPPWKLIAPLETDCPPLDGQGHTLFESRIDKYSKSKNIHTYIAITINNNLHDQN